MLQQARWRGDGGTAPRSPEAFGLRCLLVADVQGLEPHTEAWDALAEETSHPLVRPAWLLAWWRHCAPVSARLAVILVFEDESLVGVAPFYVVRDRLGLVRAELLAADASIGTGPMARAGVEAWVAGETARALAAMTPHPDVVVLSGVPAEEGWPQLLAAEWPSPTIRVTRKTVPVPLTELTAATYDQWLAGRSRNFRQQVRRRRRRLEDRGVTFSRATPERAHTALQAFTRLHLERWSSRGGSKAISASVTAMLEDAVPALLSGDGCRLLVAESGNSVVAATLFLTAGRTSTYWLGGFAEEYAADSPTIVQLADAVADGFASGREIVDFGAGDQPYKQRFASASSTLEWTSIVTARAAKRPYARLHARGFAAATAAAPRVRAARERLLQTRNRHRPSTDGGRPGMTRSANGRRVPYAKLLDAGKLKELRSATHEGRVGTLVWRSLRKRVSYSSTALGLRCDLRADLPVPAAKIPITVRPLRSDERELLRPEQGTDTPEDFYERMLRLRMFDAGLQTCYGAFAEDGRLMYVQWLIESSQNDLVHEFFEGSFPRLGPDEVLLEGAYTFPTARGQGVMAAAMAGVTAEGKKRGFATAWTFVGEHNVPSLKGCHKAGYAEQVRRREQWRLFRHRFSFAPLTAPQPT